MGQTLIPFLDLKRQYRILQPSLNRKLSSVLGQTRFILGPEVASFETEFARFCGSRFGVGVGSGTDALELALRALGIGPGDGVVTTAFTFLSTVEAIWKVGATPWLADIDPATCNLDPEQVELLLKRLPSAARNRIRTILPVHLYGHPCDMDGIGRITRREGWKLVEDCAQAHGAAWNRQPVGSFGQVNCFSFYPTKNLGAYGDAGMVVTQSAALAQRLRILRFQGRKEKDRQILWGLNSRLDELQAAILRVKFKYLPRWTRQRRHLAVLYTELLLGCPALQLPVERPSARHAYHIYGIQVPRRNSLQSALTRQGIQTAVHYAVPIHHQPLFRKLFPKNIPNLPVTDRAAKRILSLPLFPELTEQEVRRVAGAIRRFYA